MLGKGKLTTYKVYIKQGTYAEITPNFNDENAIADDLERAGEKCMLALYKTLKLVENLVQYRSTVFNRQLGTLKGVITLRSLPPPSPTCRQHSRRTYLQVQLWHERNIQPEHWVWRRICNSLVSIYTTETAAPPSNLSVIYMVSVNNSVMADVNV